MIAAAGAVDHDAFVEFAADHLPTDAVGGGSAEPPPVVPAPSETTVTRRFERKDTEQFHVCVGGRSLSRHDERRFALRVLDTIFGGTSSSRLFQEVRERYGLAYSVYSFTSAYQDTGQIGLYVGTRADNLPEAMRVVDGELARLRSEPATADELVRAKENLKGRVLLALESTGARMSRLGSEILAEAPLLGLDDVVARIDAVSLPIWRSWPPNCGIPHVSRWQASGLTSSASTKRSQTRTPSRLHDPSCGQRRLRTHGVDDVRGRRGR